MGCAGSVSAKGGEIKNSEGPKSETAPLTTDVDTLSPAMKEPRSVIVWGATGLHEADRVGKSDPYCIVRVGPGGSSWEAKAHGSGKRSPAVEGDNDPKWEMGFGTDTYGMDKPEVHIRVYDKDWATEDDFLGEAKAFFSELEAAAEPQEVKLSGEHGSVRLSAGPLDLLKKHDIKPSACYDDMQRMGDLKEVSIDNITADGPLLLGKDPLPANLQGLFWLTEQGTSSALVSFGGPNNDGGGCSTGQLLGNKYNVRVSGDRVWSFATGPLIANLKLVDLLDLVYHFVFDDGANPTKCQIYPESRSVGITLTAEWILDFEAHFLEGGDEAFPGSVVWNRPSYILNHEAKAAEYVLVQVMDAEGQKIEPAWSKFVEYQKSTEAGESPGKLWYHEVEQTEVVPIASAEKVGDTPKAEAAVEQMEAAVEQMEVTSEVGE